MSLNPKPFYLTILLLFNCFHLFAETFNTGEVINFNGKEGVLADDEGYLYISLTSNVDVSRFTINPIGFGKKIRFNDIKHGENHALLKVNAGDYYWQHVNISLGGWGNVRSSLNKDEYTFTVKPGVVNYPGSWRFTAEWMSNFRTRMKLENFNYLSYEIEHFNQHYKKLVGNEKFEYQGLIADPYPAYLATTKQKYNSVELPDLYYRYEDRKNSPMTIYTKSSATAQEELKYPDLTAYFENDFQAIRSVSPDGGFLLFNASHEDVVSIGLIAVESYEMYLLYRQKLPANTSVSELEWVDKNSFFMTLSNNDVSYSYIAHLDHELEQNTIEAEFIKFRGNGMLLDSLEDEENQLFYFSRNQRGSSKNNGLYKIDVTDEKSIDQSFRKIYNKTKKLKNVVDWLVDKQGEIRAAITYEYDKKDEESIYHYWFLSDIKSNKWQKIKTITGDENVFWLQALSPDESYFLVLTNEFGDKTSIHKYSTADGSHLGMFFEDPEHDILSIRIDHNTQKVIGYSVIENGTPQVKYFIELEQQFASAKKNNPDLQLYQIQLIEQKNKLLLYGNSQNSKGAWYVLNTQNGQTDKVFDRSPSYEALTKGSYHVIKTTAEDGVAIEGFLVMPTPVEGIRYPLVVIPHGGPIGVRDFANNDVMQHFFASQGIATLKVNFRGSSGYGKEFIELGKQQWGEKIEQDIHAVVNKVINDFAIEESKICAMGGSYGGYSSLMLTYLYPDTYRCAVSIAGVMDLPLLFTSKDLSRDEDFREKMIEIVGDPIKELDQLIAKSPLYLIDKMKQPFLLFQGMKDTRVRTEHVLRMQQMLALHNMDYEVVIFEDEGHSFSQKNTVILYLAKSLDFIKESLAIN